MHSFVLRGFNSLVFFVLVATLAPAAAQPKLSFGSVELDNDTGERLPRLEEYSGEAFEEFLRRIPGIRLLDRKRVEAVIIQQKVATIRLGEDPARAQQAYDRLAGRRVKQARDEIAAMLAEAGALAADPKPIEHPVKFFEKGDWPLEIITSRQWFVRTMEHAEELKRRGREMRWIPDWMRARFEADKSNMAGCFFTAAEPNPAPEQHSSLKLLPERYRRLPRWLSQSNSVGQHFALRPR